MYFLSQITTSQCRLNVCDAMVLSPEGGNFARWLPQIEEETPSPAAFRKCPVVLRNPSLSVSRSWRVGPLGWSCQVACWGEPVLSSKRKDGQ